MGVRIMNNSKIAIVTVCLNVEETIEKTIQSVLNQTYSNMEYVIMDGQSTDRTLEIVRKYEDDPRIRIISKKDTGLYNAMNNSLDIITGDYVLFLNSGDWLYDKNVLEDVSKHLTDDIVYGDVYRRIIDGGYEQQYKGTSFERMVMLLCGLAMCHQTMFTRTSLMREYRFDETHRITADYDFIAKAMKNKKTFKHVDRIVCSFDNVGGISAQRENYLQMLKEDDATIKENYPGWYYLIKIPKGIYRTYKIKRGLFG